MKYSEITENKYKYPRTLHLPWSLGITDDDKIVKSIKHFVGKEVVVTEKMDGESSTISRDYTHARSLDSNHHPSRDWLKQMWGEIRHEIPEGWRICGENMYAKHSIAYESLPSYFLVFSIWDENNNALSWDDTVEWCEILGLHHVKVLWRGIWNEKIIKSLFDESAGIEGYVVRLADSFHYSNFGGSLAKFVRQNHVQTNKHWSAQQIIPNKLKQPL